MASAKLTNDIKAGNKRLADSLKAGDAEGMAACYTTKGVVLAANVKPIKGRKAIAKFWAGVGPVPRIYPTAGWASI